MIARSTFTCGAPIQAFAYWDGYTDLLNATTGELLVHATTGEQIGYMWCEGCWDLQSVAFSPDGATVVGRMQS